MKTTASRFEVIRAINAVNEKYGYQLRLNTDVYKQGKYSFTLNSPSGVPGALTAANGRNIPKASWHAHGYVFDEIFKINPDAVIWSAGRKMTKNEGNWQDWRYTSWIMQSERSIL